MVKKILIILTFFICFTNASLAETKCKYFSEADVVNGDLVNKNEHYTCKEDNQNFFVTFFTDPKWEDAAGQFYTMLLVAGLNALGFN